MCLGEAQLQRQEGAQRVRHLRGRPQGQETLVWVPSGCEASRLERSRDVALCLHTAAHYAVRLPDRSIRITANEIALDEYIIRPIGLHARRIWTQGFLGIRDD